MRVVEAVRIESERGGQEVCELREARRRGCGVVEVEATWLSPMSSKGTLSSKSRIGASWVKVYKDSNCESDMVRM
jgi:hypothetical protein